MKRSEEILNVPLSKEEMECQMNEYGKVSGTVNVELERIVNARPDCFPDMLSRRLTNTFSLTDISYDVVGHHGNTLHIHVTGNASNILANI